MSDTTASDTVPADTAAFGLTWGVKASFMGYISGLQDGSIVLSEGATLTPAGTVHFPFAQTHETDGAQWIRTTGAVAFSGHYGMLAVTLRNLALRVTPEGATLLTEQDNGFYPIADVALPEPDESAEAFVWDAAAVALNDKGEAYFSQYPAGTAMDALRVALPLA